MVALVGGQSVEELHGLALDPVEVLVLAGEHPAEEALLGGALEALGVLLDLPDHGVGVQVAGVGPLLLQPGVVLGLEEGTQEAPASEVDEEEALGERVELEVLEELREEAVGLELGEGALEVLAHDPAAAGGGVAAQAVELAGEAGVAGGDVARVDRGQVDELVELVEDQAEALLEAVGPGAAAAIHLAVDGGEQALLVGLFLQGGLPGDPGDVLVVGHLVLLALVEALEGRVAIGHPKAGVVGAEDQEGVEGPGGVAQAGVAEDVPAGELEQGGAIGAPVHGEVAQGQGLLVLVVVVVLAGLGPDER